MLYLHLDNVDNVFCVGRISNFLSLSKGMCHYQNIVKLIRY